MGTSRQPMLGACTRGIAVVVSHDAGHRHSYADEAPALGR